MPPRAASLLVPRVDGTSVDLTWTSKGPVDNFNVQRNGATVATVGATIRSYTNTGVPPGTHTYRIRTNSRGDFRYSNTRTVTIAAAPGVTQAPVLTATAGAAQVALNWTAVPVATTYQLQRATGSGAFSDLVANDTDLSHLDTTAANGTTYRYQVRGKTSTSNGPYSNIASATPASGVPVAPTLTGTAGDGTASLDWNTVSNAATYRLRRQIGANPIVSFPDTTATDYIDDTAVNGVVNQYTVRGITAGGVQGSLSAPLNLTPLAGTPDPEPPGQGELIISNDALMDLPTSGTAYSYMQGRAAAFTAVNLADQNDPNGVRLWAKALIAVRTGGSVTAINSALAAAVNTEGASTLALGRKLLPVVLTADLVGYAPSTFTNWLTAVRTEVIDGRTLIDTHEERPNNWGAHAGASRIAAALYLGDAVDLAKAVLVFRGWLGDRSAYNNFSFYQIMSWHANPSQPVPVNPLGALIQGHNVDGVLPDDQRRSETNGGEFYWPPPKENYVWEALQGCLMQAELLFRQGYPAYTWSNSALGRAYAWLHNVCNFPADGDDEWQTHLVNARYGTSYPAVTPAQHGKNFGFADWLY